MGHDILYDLTPLELSSRFRGIGTYVSSLLLALQRLGERERQGLSIGVLAALSGPSAIVPLGEARLPDVGAPVLSDSRWAWARRTGLPFRLRREGPGAFHITEPLGTPRGSGVARVMTCHDLLPLALPDRSRLGRLGQQAGRLAALGRYRGARRLLAVSRFTADDAIRLLGYPASRIDVVPLAADRERFRPPAGPAEESRGREAREALGLASRPYIVYVGAPDPRKNIDTLIRAFVAAAEPDLDLALVGRYHAGERAFVERCLREAGSPRAVRLLGFVPDDAIAAVYQGAHALAFVSSYEGFGLPVLEAMSAGCPVITTRATSLAEVAGDAGLYVPPRDEGALAAAIGRVARDPSLRADLRRAGLAQAGRFSWRQTALGTVASYARALGR